MNERFAGEIVTVKGKVYRFDDVHCLLSFLKSDAMANQKVNAIYLTDFSGSHAFTKPEESFLIESEGFNSPMNGNVACFANADSMEKVKQQFNASSVSWEQLKQK